MEVARRAAERGPAPERSRPAPAPSNGLRRAAALALAFLAFFAMSDFGLPLRPEFGAYAALLLLAWCGARPWRELWALPYTRLLAAFVAFLVLHAAYASTIEPRSSYSEQLTVAAKLVKLGVFSCVVGWWLSLMPKAPPRLLALMVLGLLVAVLGYMPWQELPRLFDGSLRPRFGLPENLSGLLAAVGGWLALCLLVGAWRLAPKNPHLRLGLLAAGLVLYGGAFMVLLFSQSRGAWLAFALAVPSMLLAFAAVRRRHSRLPWVPLVAAFATTVLLAVSAHEILAQRFAGVDRLLGSVEAVVGAAPERTPSADADARASDRADRTRGTASGTKAPAPRRFASEASGAAPEAELLDASTAPNKAASVRLRLYEHGLGLARERPWFGWGLDTLPRLVAPLDLGGERHAHLHNAYLDALVGIGAVGALLLAGLFLLLAGELVQAARARVITVGSFWALAGALGIVLIANLFDSLLWRFDYTRAPLELLFGCCIAYGLIRRRRRAGTDALSAAPRS